MIARRAALVLLFASASVAASLCVAWLFCLFAPLDSENLAVKNWEERYPDLRPDPELGVVFVDVYTERSAGCEYTMELITQGQDNPFGGLRSLVLERVSCRAGWPFWALAGEVAGIPRASASRVRDHFNLAGEHDGAFHLPWIGGTKRALPWRPRWPGFLANVALFGTAAWAISVIPGAARRSIRRRRGRCAACGYPVGTAGVCSECGNPVRGTDGGTPGAVSSAHA